MTFSKIAEMIAKQLDKPLESLTPETRLIDDLKADSLDIVELMMDLEQEFEVEIPDEATQNIRTIGDIVRYIESK